MKGKSKSKKILETSKSKNSIENLYKKYKSQESYNDFKILTKNFNTKITLPKPNICGISPTNNNNLTNNSLSNNLNNNKNNNNNRNRCKYNKKPPLKLNNFFEITNSTATNYNYSKMVSPNSLRSNVYSNISKFANEKNTKNAGLNIKNITERKHFIYNNEKINKNKLTDNSFEIEEVNCEKRINFDNELLFNNPEAKSINKSNEKEINLLSSNGKVIDKKSNEQELKSKLDQINFKEKSSNFNLDFEAFKNANNFYTNSICEFSDSFIEKGDKNLINNVPDTFVRQTENRLLENTSSKKLIQITNYQSNRDPFINKLKKENSDLNNYLNLNNKINTKKDFGTKIISEENIIDSDSCKNELKEEDNIKNKNNPQKNNFIKNLDNKNNGSEASTPKSEYEKIKFTNDSNVENKSKLINLNLDKNLIKTNSANRIDVPGLKLLSELELNKYISIDIINLRNFSIESKRESEENSFQLLTPSEICEKKLLNYSKKGDKESFLKTLTELYALEGESLDIHFFNEAGKNCLQIACEEGNLKIVEILLKINFNFELKVKDKLSKKTALHVSCEKGYFDISKMLIEKGAEIGSLDAELNTPLHLCAENNHVELFQYLLDKSKNIDSAKNSNGETAFDIALKDKNKNELKDKFNKIIIDYYQELSEANKILNNKNKNIYETSPRKPQQIKQTMYFSNSNKSNNNNITSQFFSSINNSGSMKNEKFNFELKCNHKNNKIEKPNLIKSNKNSSKELSNNSKIYNIYNTANSSNVNSDLSTNLIIFSKKDSSNLSNSQFSNYKSNFNYYKKNNQRMSSNKNKNLSNNSNNNNNNNLSNKNILNSNSKNLDDSNNNNYKLQLNLEKNTNKIKTINFNIGDLSNSSNSNSKLTKKTNNSLLSQNLNSNSISSKFKKVESVVDNFSSEINNYSNNNSNDDIDSSNSENIDCLEILNENKKVNVSDFICHLILGKGSFGEVYLVEEKSSKQFFAMKVLKKEKIIGN